MRPALLVPGLLLLALPACAPATPDGVILISMDTLRADRLGAYGSTAGLTPNLDRFASESVVFTSAYAQANETLYSHAALFTGRYPSRLAPLDGAFRIPEGTPTLAATFGHAGWSTAAFVAGGHLSRAFGLDAGFTTYDDAAAWGSLHDTGPRALQWLDHRPDAPFFLFVHGYDTHDRYLKPTPFGYAFADPSSHGLGATLVRRIGGASGTVGGRYSTSVDAVEQLSLDHPRFDRGRDILSVDPSAVPLTPDDAHQLAAAYDGAVAWADASFGLFLAGLEDRGLLDRVVIVVVSDHGEELGEHGVFAHRYSLDDETTHVPLLVRLPGAAHAGDRVTGLTALLDVAPTLLDLAGLTGLADGDARSLRPALEGDAAFGRPFVLSEGALRLTSARGPSARLTVEGVSAENPLAAAIFAVAPVDGVSTTVTPADAPASDVEALRAALVTLRSAP